MGSLRTTAAVALWLLCSCAGLPYGPTAQSEFEAGLALFNAGRYEEALPRFSRSTELDPGYAKAYLYLGRSRLNLRQWVEALPPLRSAYRLSPRDLQAEVADILLDALFSLAVDEVRRGNFGASIEHLKEGLALQPRSERLRTELVGSWVLLGQRLLTEQKFPEAVGAFREAVTLYPDHVNGYLGLAQALFLQGDLWNALKAAETAIRIDPSGDAGQSLLRDLLRQR